MLFAVYCKDKRGSDLRSRIRADHLKHVMDHPQVYRLGCPLIGEDGKSVGSLFLFEVADRAHLDQVLAADPYFREGLYESVDIHATRQVVPETAPGLLAAELEKERSAQRPR